MSFNDLVLKEMSEIEDVIGNFTKILRAYNPNLSEKLNTLYKLIEQANFIHVYGVGRTGTCAVALALRLNHFGYNISFLGDVIKPRISKEDICIFFSGSGETKEIIVRAETAKREGAKIIAITSYPESTLAKLADMNFIIPGGLEKRRGWAYVPAQLSHLENILSELERDKKVLAETRRILGKLPEHFYSGGAFELLSYIFQETLVTAIGKRKGLTQEYVGAKHERD